MKRYLPTSLLGRTLLIILLPLLILQIAVAFVFFDRHWDEMTQRLAFAVAGEMKGAIRAYRDNPDALDDIQELLQTTVQLHMTMQDGQTKLKSSSGKIKTLPWTLNLESGIKRDLSHEIKLLSEYPFDIDVQPDQKIVTVSFLIPEGVITFTIPERRLFSSSSYIFILWMMALSVLLFTIAILFMRNQIRPIHRLGITAERLGRGIPVGKLKPSGAREVRQAAEAFVKMQDRINQFIDQRTTMLAGVSHDLKTPLTRMKLQLEMMDDTPDKQAMIQDIDDMERMIAGYLSFAKGDGGEAMQRVNLMDVLVKLSDDAKRLSLSVDEQFDAKDDLMIWARPVALVRAFDNFISNADRYADKIYLSCDVKKDVVSVVIEDNGEGIPKDALDDMMKPFVRGDQSRNTKTGGVGLGLTIANDIITAIGGSVELSKSDELGGLRVTVTLPI